MTRWLRTVLGRTKPNRGWLLEDVRRELQGDRRARQPLERRIAIGLEEIPVGLACLTQGAIALMALLLWRWQPSVAVSLAPVDAGHDLLDVWQVHVGFVAITFAGLTFLLQLAAEPVVPSRSLRAMLFRDTFFMTTFMYALVGAVQLGIVALWFANAATLLLEFVLVVAVTVFGVGRAYYIAAKVFSDPGAGLRLGTEELVEAARDSIYADFAVMEANQRLFREVDRGYWGVGVAEPQQIGIAQMSVESQIEDVRLAEVRDAIAEFRAAHVSLGLARAQVHDIPDPEQVDERPSPVVRLLAGIGDRVRAGQPLFLVENIDPSAPSLNVLARRLIAAFRLKQVR